MAPPNQDVSAFPTPPTHPEQRYDNSVLPAYQKPFEDDEVNLRDVIDILIRGKWIILATLVTIVTLVGIYTIGQPSQYRASTLLLVDAGGSDLRQMLPSGTGLPSRSSRFIENELLILRQSLPLAEAAAERLIHVGNEGSSSMVLTILGTSDGRPATTATVAARLQGSYVTATPASSGVDAITLTAVSTDPAEAALIANIYADEYLRQTRDVSRSRIGASRAFLEEQVAARSAELAETEDAIRNFMTREGAIALDEQTSRIVNQVGQLQGMRDEVGIELQMRQASLSALESELEAIQPNLAERFSSGVEDQLRRAQTRRADLELRLDEIHLANPQLRNVTAAPPEVAELERRLAEVRREITALSDRYVDEVRSVGGYDPVAGEGLIRVSQLQRQAIGDRIAITGLEARQDVIAARLREYDRRMQTLPAQAIDLARLQRTRVAVEKMYVFLVERLQELQVAEQGELGYAQIIRPAGVPAAPFSPDRPRNMILGVLIGLLVGVGIAAVVTRLDHTLRRPDDLTGKGKVLVGVVPSLETHIADEFGGQSRVTVNGRSFDTHLVSLLDPLSPASEAFRSLRTNIQFSLPDAVVGTILITSSTPGEGKSLSAANLAIVMAQAGRRTLLVDADLRRPTVHRLFDVPRAPGLCEMLFTTNGDKLGVQPSGVENLDLLPAGGAVPNPSELLGSRSMRDLIEGLRQEYDLIVFDSPPVQAATDPVLVSTQCDATLVVVQAGRTKDFDLDHTIDMLRNVGARIIGVHLNRFDASRSYGYKYMYRNRYSYKYER